MPDDPCEGMTLADSPRDQLDELRTEVEDQDGTFDEAGTLHELSSFQARWESFETKTSVIPTLAPGEHRHDVIVERNSFRCLIREDGRPHPERSNECREENGMNSVLPLTCGLAP